MGSEGDYGRVGDVAPAIETVRAIYAAFARRDVEGAIGHMAPDISFAPAGTAARLGRTDPYVGHDGIRRYFTDVARVWEELTLVADDIRATAGGVVVFGTVTGRLDGEPFRATSVWIWRVHDGKAISMRVSVLDGALPDG